MKKIMKAKNESWTKYIYSLDHPGNPSVFWNFAQSMINGKKTQYVWPNLIDAPNHHLTTPMEKANALLDQFCPNTTQIVDDRDILYEQIIHDAIVNEDPHPLNTSFNIMELKNCTRGLSNKAMGADRIHNKMLHLTPI